MSLKTFSAGGIVLNPQGEILLILQRGNVWSLPKGHLERTETAEQAARREIQEEAGLRNLELVAELGSYERYKIGEDGSDDTSELKHITCFLFRGEGTILQPEDESIRAAEWVPPAGAVGRLHHPRDREFLAAFLSKGSI